MKLIAYMIDGHRMDIRPAPIEREWMDNTGERFAYRCLPLNIANAHGWEILCPSGFVAAWNGGRDKDAIEIFPDEGTVAPAIIETDWAPYSFTMNWQFTRPGAAVRFEKDEPYCHIFPVRRGQLEAFEP